MKKTIKNKGLTKWEDKFILDYVTKYCPSDLKVNKQHFSLILTVFLIKYKVDTEAKNERIHFRAGM